MVAVVTNSDDDLSTSSTLAENSVKEVQLQQSEKSSNKGQPNRTNTASSSSSLQRTVRFNEESNQYYESTSSLLSKEDSNEKGESMKALLWYSRRECRAFRDVNDTIARKIAQSEGGYLSMRNPFSYQNVMQRVYESCCFSAPPCNNDDSSATTETDGLTVEERELLRWLTIDLNGGEETSSFDRWGLERVIVYSIALDRFYRRHALMDLVYHLQEEFETNSNAKKDGLCRGSFDECLRLHCEALTRPSCLFAMQLGQATAAATNTNNNTPQ